ncbi:hypothetical protein F5X68DRAFT_157450 [Plectosphaerella plurivora]|uniref:Zn(2)-C6 fungal-type domain-containing protein n=1 Tax=Plectosphaerella plurivora TaxID=936078 RepID=A0A9P8V5J7_9PEZI|nr:hypothetical protein F5X68DRAFT_157450 [Plectosphaerella plurivora]
MSSTQPADPEREREPGSPIPSKKTRSRASKACLVCRRRKVRCNVAITGPPCSNCTIDGETCTIPEKSQKKWSRQPHRPASTETPAANATAADRLARKHRHRHEHATTTTAPPEDDASQHEPIETDIVLTRPGSPSANSHSSGHASPVEQHPSWDRPGPSSWHHAHAQPNSSLFITTVPMSAYPFLTASNLHRLPPEDVNFLELKSCLRLPARIYLDEILQQYFRYVHPFFPLINEALFWDVYHGADMPGDTPLPGTRFPLLVLQAMLFTACSFVSPATLEKLGYTSVRQARRTMYERAKLLFNMESENSRLHMAQAALLLSYWTPPFEEAAFKPNTGWLRVAIENARSVRAHQYTAPSASTKASIEDYEQIALKRLWGCCIIRGGTLAISSRRCCQDLGLDPDSNTGFPLTFEDLEDEVHESRVYDPETKRSLISAFLGLAEICVHVVATSILLFPLDNSQPGQTKLNDQMDESIRILTCKMTLDRWHGTTPRELTYGSGGMEKSTNPTRADNASITLFTNLQDIYFYSARIALANRQMLSCYTASPPRIHEILELHEEVQQATAAVGKCFRTLTERRLDRFLPVSVIPCIALPLALNTTAGKSRPSSPKAQIFNDAMNTYNTLYEGVDGLARAVRVIVNQGQGTSQSMDMTKPSGDGSNPLGYYMRLALSIDLSLSSGNLPDDRDFPARVQEHLSSSPESQDQVGLEPPAEMMQAPGGEEWMVPDESMMAATGNEAKGGELWDLEGLSPRAAEYRILESMIWSSPSPGVF